MANHQHFMQIALTEAANALNQGEFPVGCVLVHDDRVVARGRRRNSRTQANELDHAEIVALHDLLDNQPEIDCSGVTLYCTMEPCLMCFAALLLSNVHTIVYAYEDAMGGGTAINLNHLTPLYRQMEVTVIPHVMRNESLALFKKFFTNPANKYWRNSFLADYTLSQD
jgi:tRNA(adenine34) deaminase